MKTHFFAAVLLCGLLASFPVFAQSSGGGSGGGSGGCIATVATLSSKCGTVAGTIASVTDGSSATDCTGGGGSNKNACIYGGASWAFAGSSAAGTVTVVGAGTLTSTNIVTGGGAQTVQTPSSSATVDSSGNVVANSFSGPGAISGLTTGHLSKASAATSLADTSCDELTANTLTCTHSLGLVLTGPLAVTGDGVHTGAAQLVGNTTEPARPANTFSWGGPLSASFTSFGWNPPVAENGSAGIVHVGAASSHWSPLTISAVTLSDHATQAADTVVMNASGSTAAPTAVVMPACAASGHADVYDPSTHTWTCNTTGVTPTIAEWWNVSSGFVSAMSAITQNAGRVWSFYLPAQITSSAAICYYVQAADNSANVYDIGIYNSSGTLLVDTGATAGTTLFSGTAFKCANWSTPTTLPQGYYALALTSSAAAPAAKLGGTSSYVGDFATVNASGGTWTGGALSASITFPSTLRVNTEAPNFSLH